MERSETKFNHMNEENFFTDGTTSEKDRAQGDAQQKAKDAALSAANEAGKLKDAAKEKGGAALEQVKAGAATATQQAKEAGRNYLAQQKDTLGNKVGEYAEAVHAAAERLKAENGNMLAEPAGRAAEQLDRFAGYLREADPTEILDDLEEVARCKPEVVFGGLFVAGLVTARFLKASRRRSPRSQPLPLTGRTGRGSSSEFSVENRPMVGPSEQAYGDQLATANLPSTGSNL
jgi:hypothetical protein